MFSILFGTWKGRALVLVTCVVSFAIGITAALTTAVKRDSAYLEQVESVPLVGAVAVKLAGVEPEPTTLPDEEDRVYSYATDHPLSADEIASLIQDLKRQKQEYAARAQELSNEASRLELLRKDLKKERSAIDALRDEIRAEWEAIQKAREEVRQRVAALPGEQEESFKKLAKSYAAMKAEYAAEALNKMEDEATVARLLMLMPERNVGKIMEKMPGEKAARLTVQITSKPEI
jgi:flagellar motility protein MotE (MotC chaperone)